MAGKGQFGVKHDSKVLLFLDALYIIKRFRRVIHWNSLFRKGHLNCLLAGVRVKGHSPIVLPKLNKIQRMVYIRAAICGSRTTVKIDVSLANSSTLNHLSSH